MKLQPDGMLRVHDFRVDQSVLLYIVAITCDERTDIRDCASGMDAPARSRGAFKGGGARSRARRADETLGEALVVGEVALALLMTVGAGLLVTELLASSPRRARV